MSLRQQVLRGGAYLSARHALGMVVGLGGMVLLTRLLGPEQYGLYAVGAALFLYFQLLCQCGIDVFLVRREGSDDVEAYHLAHTLLLILSAVGTALALVAVPIAARWLELDGLELLAGVLLLALPLAVVARVPMSRLERALDYRSVAFVELAGQGVFYTVAVALAWQGWGVWSPVVAWWLQHAVTLAIVYRRAAYRPQLRWDRTAARDMLKYGFGYSASVWVWQGRMLVNPLIVGRFAGPSGVAYVSLAIRLVGAMSFVAASTYRLSIAAFARLRSDPQRLRDGITEGMHLQLLALGPILLAFALFAPSVVPLVFGADWMGVLVVFPFIAVGSLVNSVFSLHCSALYVLRQNAPVAAFHAIHVALFAGAALILVPRVGLVGYGVAELVALTSYVAIHAFVTGAIGRPRYALAAVWGFGFGLALFVRELGVLALAGAVAMMLWPTSWTVVRGYARSMLGVRHAA